MLPGKLQAAVDALGAATTVTTLSVQAGVYDAVKLSAANKAMVTIQPAGEPPVVTPMRWPWLEEGGWWCGGLRVNLRRPPTAQATSQ